ncbi:MAG: hypothetical protein KGK07_15615 [Chloroflexota bacterium]|nr:hypothetical protein [Chloroflexota bacterium]
MPQTVPASTGDEPLVFAAQAGDADARERLIALRSPMAVSVASRVCGRWLQPGRDEELSIGLLALDEAVSRYKPGHGSFAHFAAIVVRRRLIDHLRRQTVQREVPFSEFDQDDGEGGTWNPADYRAAQDAAWERQAAEDRRGDVEELCALLRQHGMALADVMRERPEHVDSRARAAGVARAMARRPDWMAFLQRHRTLPYREIETEPGLHLQHGALGRKRRWIAACALVLAARLDSIAWYLPKPEAGDGGVDLPNDEVALMWSADERAAFRAHPEQFDPRLHRTPAGRFRVWLYSRYLPPAEGRETRDDALYDGYAEVARLRAERDAKAGRRGA